MEIKIKDDDLNTSTEGKEVLAKDTLKGQKILIVMLYSRNLNPEENPYIHKDYLLNSIPQSDTCLKDCLDHFGIIVDIVENYRDAIEKITSKNENKKCPYYAVWIINGPPYEELPDGSKEAFLLGQFLQVIKLFWEKGGALVFLAGGGKFQYQTNEFLKILEFDGKKVEFHLVGNDEEKGTKEHIGGKLLIRDNSGLLKNKLQFSSKNEHFGCCERLNLGHYLYSLFEGNNISYTNTDNYEKLLPFHPFSRDSDGGISALYYLSDEKMRGDIFIDCGFTKLFLNMKKDNSIYQYFQNIAAWTARPEIHIAYEMIEPKDWRPDCIDYKIDPNKKWTKFLSKPAKTYEINLFKLKTLFAFDNSGSITGNELYFSEINRLLNKYYKPGDKVYLWGTKFSEKSKKQIDEWIKLKLGNEGTDIINIAKLAKESPDHREHLIIVTDGRASLCDIEKCDKFLKKENIKFQYVSVYIIGKEGDRSVGAPFCRNCPNRNILVLDQNNRINVASLSVEYFNRLNIGNP